MDLLQGTLDLLVPRALELAPMHGVGVADRIYSGGSASSLGPTIIVADTVNFSGNSNLR